MSLRDILWDYPDYLVGTFNVTRPVSLILLFGTIFVILTSSLINSDILKTLQTSNDGRFVEGTVGQIDILNPIFTTSNQAEKDIEALIFQKLIHIDSNANPLPEIAIRWEKTENNLEHVFTLRDDIYFSDGEKLTAEDVEYTFNTAIYLSKNRGENTIGDGLQNVAVQKIADNKIKFTLSEPNATFYEAVSVFIVPKHYYGKVNTDQLPYAELNSNPIGSGPYKIVTSRSSGITLEANSYFTPQPKVKYFEYKVYKDFESLKVAFQNYSLDAVSNISAYKDEFLALGGGYNQYTGKLPFRMRLLFFNNRLDLLKDNAIRRGISYLIDKGQLLSTTGIEGTIRKGPYPEFSWAFNTEIKYYEFSKELADVELKQAGFTKNEQSGYYQTDDGKILSVKLTYLDNERNRKLVTKLIELLGKEGIIIEPDPRNLDVLTREVLATRNFEMLLFEVETTIDPDQYNLWHSLKADYPDLNLAGYNFSRVDVILERARKSYLQKDRTEDYFLFQKYLISDAPVVFLYEPVYDYFVVRGVKGAELDGVLLYPEDRYRDVYEWEFEN